MTKRPRRLEEIEADIDSIADLSRRIDAPPYSLADRAHLLTLLSQRRSPLRTPTGYGARLDGHLTEAQRAARIVGSHIDDAQSLRRAVRDLRCELVAAMGEVERLKGESVAAREPTLANRSR